MPTITGLNPAPSGPLSGLELVPADLPDGTTVHLSTADIAALAGTGGIPPTTVFGDGINFSVSTASTGAGTTQRGNITFSTGDNDTFTGCQLVLGGATPSGNGDVSLTVGNAATVAANSVTATVGDWSFYLSGDAGIESSGAGEIYLTAGAGLSVSVTSNISFTGGDFQILTPGKGLDVAEGANARMGLATLSGGTVTVSTTAVAANSRIFLTPQDSGTIAVPAALGVSTRTAGASFDITSADAADDRTVAWVILAPL